MEQRKNTRRLQQQTNADSQFHPLNLYCNSIHSTQHFYNARIPKSYRSTKPSYGHGCQRTGTKRART